MNNWTKYIIIYPHFAWCIIFFISCDKEKLPSSQIQLIESHTDAKLYDILFTNSGQAYIVGGELFFRSDFLHSSDSGQSWTIEHNDAASKAVYGLCEQEERRYAVGLDGKIFVKQTDSNEWQYIQTQFWEVFSNIDFVSPDKGFVVSGRGYDSGFVLQINTKAEVINSKKFDFALYDIVFCSHQIGFASGFGAIIKTEDGGENWSIQNVQGDIFKALTIKSESEIWAVGYHGSIICTQDGGLNWTKIRNGNNPTLKRFRFRDIAFKNKNEGYIVGDKGLILKTTDGGQNWKEIQPFTNVDLMAIAFSPDASLFIVGDKGSIWRIR